MKFKNKLAFEFSFAWLFAVFVGALIILFAVFITLKIIKSGSFLEGTTAAREISIILEHMETGMASGKSSIIKMNKEITIENKCYSSGSFGRNEIKAAGKFAGKWQKKGLGAAIPNKYIFSNITEQGKNIYLFSKPFSFPWKVSELIFMTTKKYCFVNAPEEIREEIKNLQIENIKIENCTNEIRVCFNGGNCEIKVEGMCNNCDNKYEYGVVRKEGKSVFYYKELIYGAIFASPNEYECNVKRLMKRLTHQAGIFKEEAEFLSGKCGEANSLFLQIAGLASALNKSNEMIVLFDKIKEANEQNEASECKFW